jgi:outer membrane protein assembly complex protein YaeT
MLGLALAASAWAGQAEPVSMRLGQVRFNGPDLITASELAELMEQSPPSLFSFAAPPQFDRGAVERDRQRIVDYYHERGFFNVEVKITPQFLREDRVVHLDIDIREGNVFFIESIAIILPNPEDEFWRPALNAVLLIREGEAIAIADYAASKEALRKYLADNGHPLCKIKGQILAYSDDGEDGGAAQVRFLVEAGPEIKFGALRFSGNLEVSEEFIRRRLSFLPGQIYAEKELVSSQENIFASGLFTNLTLTPLLDQIADGQVEIAIDCLEAAPHTVSLGLGWGAEDQFRMQIHQLNRNLLGIDDTFSIEGKYSAIYLGMTGRLHIPIQDLAFEVAGGARQTDNEAYNDRAFFINPSFNFKITPQWALSAGFNARLYRMRELKTIVQDPSFYGRDLRINSLPLALSYDTRDSILNPGKGALLGLNLEIASQIFSSEVSFIAAGAGISQIIPLAAKHWALAWRAKGGAIIPTENSDDIPLYLRFFPGGVYSMRGYRYQNLGPLDANSRPLGGEAFLESSIELRFPVAANIGGAIFMDAGNAFANYSDYSDGLRFSCGAGLFYNTPLGPVRLDFGYILNPDDAYDYSRYQIYLSVGQVF